MINNKNISIYDFFVGTGGFSNRPLDYTTDVTKYPLFRFVAQALGKTTACATDEMGKDAYGIICEILSRGIYITDAMQKLYAGETDHVECRVGDKTYTLAPTYCNNTSDEPLLKILSEEGKERIEEVKEQIRDFLNENKIYDDLHLLYENLKKGKYILRFCPKTEFLRCLLTMFSNTTLLRSYSHLDDKETKKKIKYMGSAMSRGKDAYDKAKDNPKHRKKFLDKKWLTLENLVYIKEELGIEGKNSFCSK